MVHDLQIQVIVLFKYFITDRTRGNQYFCATVEYGAPVAFDDDRGCIIVAAEHHGAPATNALLLINKSIVNACFFKDLPHSADDGGSEVSHTTGKVGDAFRSEAGNRYVFVGIFIDVCTSLFSRQVGIIAGTTA